MLLTKVAHQSANPKICHYSHSNSPNSSCHFWNQELVFLQTWHHSSVSWDICTFSSQYLYSLDKRIQSGCKFVDFWLLAWKLTQFLMSFFNPQVSFCLSFATLFSVMAYNSSEIFKLKHYMLWTKRVHQCTIFRLLVALMRVHPIPHAIFETTRSGFIQIMHHCSVSWKITPLCFFISNLTYFG